ncbi:hypothetical protein Tco_0991720 [Tanacetum coccineum]|uniref:Uncharacterized protein n=1 Tax=Tanacetum coccineum TaxID=301880 RepID=A0ABQ5F002_9ASTR
MLYRARWLEILVLLFNESNRMNIMRMRDEIASVTIPMAIDLMYPQDSEGQNVITLSSYCRENLSRRSVPYLIESSYLSTPADINSSVRSSISDYVRPLDEIDVAPSLPRMNPGV